MTNHLNIECIVFDLDGTLLAGTPHARLSLKYWLSQNDHITVIFASGRSMDQCQDIINDPFILMPDFWICDVGCSLYDASFKFLQPLHHELCNRWPGDDVLFNSMPELRELQQQDIIQVNRKSFFIPDSEYENYINLLSGYQNQKDIDLLFSHGIYLDALPKNVNKGSTLLKLLNHLNIHPDKAFIFGNSENDFSMLSISKNGYLLYDDSLVIDHRKTFNRTKKNGCDGILEAMSVPFIDEGAMQDSSTAIIYRKQPNSIDGQSSHPNGILSGILPFDPEEAPFDYFLSVNSGDADGISSKVCAHTLFEQLIAPEKLITNFYHECCRNYLWPMFHDQTKYIMYIASSWPSFCAMNDRVALRLANKMVECGHVIIHDYNFILVPGILRLLRPDLKISYFHHIPWIHKSFDKCQHKSQMLYSLSYCNHIYMHIPQYLNDFKVSLSQVVPCSVSQYKDAFPQFNTKNFPVCSPRYPSVIKCEARSIHLHAHPMPVNTLVIDSVLPSLNRISQNKQDKLCFLVVSRMDYSKGIKEFIDNLYYIFITSGYIPEKSIFFDLIFVETEYTNREPYSSYAKEITGRYHQLLDQLSGEQKAMISFSFTTSPSRGFDLYAKYLHADALIVPSLSDGLNLVAKEYLYVNSKMKSPSKLMVSDRVGVIAELKCDYFAYTPASNQSFFEGFKNAYDSIINYDGSIVDMPFTYEEQCIQSWSLFMMDIS